MSGVQVSGASSRRFRTCGFWAGRMTASTSVVRPAETIVLRWVDAFNARDLQGMLECLDADVRFRPLRLSGLSGSYRGHDGVCEWFARMRVHHEHRILVAAVQPVGEDRVSVVGSLCLGADLAIAPFCGLHRVRDGRIVTAHHYLTDPDMIEYLGLIP
jgi:ketosteroid isomerase-like protein